MVKINVNGRELDAIIITRVEVRVSGFRHVGAGLTEEEAIKDFERQVAPIMGVVEKAGKGVPFKIVGDTIEHPKSAQRPLGVTQRFGRD